VILCRDAYLPGDVGDAVVGTSCIERGKPAAY
jgi:hypothetical protein